jgi:hypothetical protein
LACGSVEFFVSSLLLSRSAGNGARSIANVGRRGSGRSKKWTGRLLQMPPSENQWTPKVGVRACGCPKPCSRHASC